MTQRLLLPASRFLLALALLLLVVVTGLLAAGAGAAALEPVETDPHAGAEVGELHEAIRITFDEPLLLERGVNTAVVLDGETGRPIEGARAEVSGYSDRTLLIHADHLPEEGVVEVRWTVRDRMGEEFSDTFSFAIAPGAEVDEAEPLEGAAAEPRGRESLVLWTVLIVLAVAAFGIGVYFLRLKLGLGKSSLEEDAH
ncbi:MAG: copper resistance protein CopC [Chloroflexi bacterium]|nr:copper resistance protein CopC [Chloroflexota bacterium]